MRSVDPPAHPGKLFVFVVLGFLLRSGGGWRAGGCVRVGRRVEGGRAEVCGAGVGSRKGLGGREGVLWGLRLASGMVGGQLNKGSLYLSVLACSFVCVPVCS